jgi:hypothetical protein
MKDDITPLFPPVNGGDDPRKKFRLLEKVMGDRRLSEADLRVAYFIIDWFGIDGRRYTFTRHDRLAKYTGLDARTVRRCIAKLVALGYIIIKMRGRWGRASEYLPVFLPIYGDKAQSSCSPHMRTSQSAHEDKTMSAHEDKAMSTQTLPPRSANEGVVVSPADAGLAPDGARPRGVGAASDGAAPFEAFWAVYPRKEGRAAARKAFDAATARGVSVETLIDGARRYAAAKAHADPNWLKFPATWLRDECWLEDPQPPRRKEPKPDRTPRAAKANGKAEPRRVEPAEPDDDEDEYEYETPEQLYPSGSCVWYRPDGRKGEVISARDDGGLYYAVKVRWEPSGAISSITHDQLVTEDPLTPEERAAAEVEWAKREAEAKAAAEAMRAKREAEAEEERKAEAARQARYAAACAKFAPTYRELLRRFPIGSRVDLIRGYDERYNGEVLRITPDCGDMEVLWEGETESSWVEDYNVKDLVPAGVAPDDDADGNSNGAEVTAP